MQHNTLQNFADKHSIDFDANAARLVGDATASPISEWATSYAQEAPIYHVTDLDTATLVVYANEPLKSHAALHPTKQYGGAVENTIGRTAEFDVACGLDEFVFLSLGKLATTDIGPVAAFTLHKDVLQDSVTSFKDIAAMDAIVLCPAEQFNEDDADQQAVNSANADILRQFAASLVPANEFAVPFARYLDTNFSSVDDFLQTFSFKKGVIDLPPAGSPAHDELVAQVKLFNQLAPGRAFDYFTHGHYYAGPQIMAPDYVATQHIQSVILYEGDVSNRAKVKQLLQIAQKRGVYADLVTLTEVSDHVAANLSASTKDITMSEVYIATRAAMNVLFNKKAA